MSTLRDDLMNSISRYRELNIKTAMDQPKDCQEGLLDALRYQIKADAADSLTMMIHDILCRHGL